MLRVDIGEAAEALGIDFHDGYEGPFTRDQAIGALPNGTRIFKINSEKGDATPNGTMGQVLGSIGIPVCPDIRYRLGYFVEWDAFPKRAVFVLAYKLGSGL